MHHAGAHPVIVDVEPDTLNMDPAAVARALTPRTRAVMPVYLHGHPADLDPLLWRETLARLPFLGGLTAEEVERLRRTVILFLHNKSIRGAGGLTLGPISGRLLEARLGDVETLAQIDERAEAALDAVVEIDAARRLVLLREGLL